MGTGTLFLTPKVTHAIDTGGYPWADATTVPGKSFWGYTTCPSSDTNCMAAKVKGTDGKTYGVADPYSFYLRYCTSFVAWKLNTVNGIPFKDYNYENKGKLFGDASTWASVAQSIGITVDHNPAVGSVAWFGVSVNHVAWVSAINQNGTVQIEEYNNPAGSGNYYSPPRSITKASAWYIHFKDIGSGSGSPSTPTAISRTSSTMAVFYNDGSGNLVNWSWDANRNPGWTAQKWTVNFNGDTINGQPTAVTRDSSDMDVFYRTSGGKLVNMGWNSTNGWSSPNILLSSGVAGDPAVVSRDSGDMQVFFLTSAGEIKSVSWNSTTGWNLNAQLLYSSGATSDPAAISRTSDSMDVFFGKNNGNLVHLGWTATYGWNTQDWNAGSGLTGRPTAITRNGGGDMSAYYQEHKNGYVAEESWDWQTGWAWRDWQAQLVGSPSAVAGVSNVIDVFYRETGGNIVDRYFNGYVWATTNIVGINSATGNPFALVRGPNLEVFYWNGSKLMDALWDATNGWSTAPVG
jgi:surface antigen